MQGGGADHEIKSPPPPTEVAEHERQPQPHRQGCLGAGIPHRNQTRLHLTRRKHERGDGRERHEAPRAANRTLCDRRREPVAAEGVDVGDESLTGCERQTDRMPRLVQRCDAVAHRQPPQPQPLLLDAEILLLGRELALELPLKVIEEVVPAHGVTLDRHIPAGKRVIHSLIASMDRGGPTCLGGLYPPQG